MAEMPAVGGDGVGWWGGMVDGEFEGVDVEEAHSLGYEEMLVRRRRGESIGRHVFGGYCLG